MKTFQNSYIFALLTAVDRWFRRQWEESRLAAWLTGQNSAHSQSSLATGVTDKIRSLYCRVFEALRLPKLLEGSIFLHPMLFVALAIILAPVMPTMVILALVCGGFFSLCLKLGVDRSHTITPSPLNGYVMLYAFLYFYTTLTSTTVSGSLFPGLLTIAFVMFFFAVTSSGLEGKWMERLLVVLMVVGVGISLYGFYQFLFPEKFRNVWTDTDMFSTIAFRVYSTLENPNVLGEYFLLVIPIGCAMTLTVDTWPKRLAALAATGIMGICLILTYSRGCYLGLLFAAAVFLVLLDRRFIFLGILAVLTCPLYLPESVLSRFASIGDMGDTSTSYRVSIWLGTLAMLKKYWVCGLGPGTAAFNTVYPDFAYSATTAQHPHSLYLQLLCDGGFIVLTVFAIIVISFYRMMFTAIRHEKYRSTRIFQIAGTASISGFLVQSTVDYSFYNYRVMMLFFSMMGLCVLFARAGAGLAANVRDEDAPIRVLNIISDSNIGGAGRCLINYLKYCDRSRFVVCVVLPRGSKLIPEIRALDVPIIEADGIADRSFSPAAIGSLVQIIKQADPELIHTHGSLSGRIAGKLCGCKVVYTRHSAFPISSRLKFGPVRWLNGVLNGILADRIIAVSPATKDNLVDSGISEKKIVVMPNGVAPLQRSTDAVCRDFRAARNIPDDVFTIVYPARMELYKGHLILLDAAHELKQAGRAFQILIAGHGSDADYIAQQIDQRGLSSHVKLLGFVSDIASLLSIADIQVNCSYESEACSMAIIEGLSMGLPCVASHCSGNPWLITDNICGLLFENKNAHQLAECIGKLMDDSQLLHRMSENALAVYGNRFTGETFANNIERVYTQILKAK